MENKESQLLSVNRSCHFNSAHRLYNKNWDDTQNFEVFGKCSYPNYHGHNYNLDIQLSGTINKETGYVIDLKMVADILKSEIEDVFDHKNLNLDLPFFKDLIPTAENIAIVIYDILKPKFPKLDLKITLFETENNIVTFSG